MYGHFPVEYTGADGKKGLYCNCGGTLPCPHFVPGEIVSVPAVADQITAQLDERIAKLEAERDAMVAKYQDSYAEACHLAAVMQSGQPAFDALGLLLTSFHGDPAAHLAARDARMKRAGAIEALRGLPGTTNSDYETDWDAGWDAYCAKVRAAIAALEQKGEGS